MLALVRRVCVCVCVWCAVRNYTVCGQLLQYVGIAIILCKLLRVSIFSLWWVVSANFPPPHPPNPTRLVLQMAATITATAQALYDFNQDGSSPNCLAFKQSELIYVYERLDSGWWQGVLVATPTQGGWFPGTDCTGGHNTQQLLNTPPPLHRLANYAQVVEEGPPANPPNADAQSVSTEDLDEDQADADSTSDTTSTHNQVSGNQPLLESTILAAVALQDYQANAYDGDGKLYYYKAANRGPLRAALSFRKGDSLAVLEMNPTGLWKGFINGKEGYFPSRYVRLEDSSSSGSNENLRQSLAGLENRKSSASMASPLSAPRAQTPVQAAAPVRAK